MGESGREKMQLIKLHILKTQPCFELPVKCIICICDTFENDLE